MNSDRIETFFKDIETQQSILTTITDLHKTLKSQTESFKSHLPKSFELLQIREDAIPELQSAATKSVAEKKAFSIASWSAENPNPKGDLSENLKIHFLRMDATGLMKYLITKRKDPPTVVLRAAMEAAVSEAVDAFALVLDAVEEFVEAKGGAKVGVADMRWACGTLMQTALPVPVPVGRVGVARNLKERAGQVLDKWEGMFGGVEKVGTGEATMFLQMVIGFCLKDKYDKEFYRKLIVEYSARRDMPKIALALGFQDKMEGIIDDLVKSGKELDAVYFSTEAGLTERFPPASLLKSCLENSQKNAAKTTSKNGNTAAREDANALEMSASRSVIKCVEDLKLESEFPIDGLKKRVTQLEKAKAEMKKTAFSKPYSNKRPRNGLPSTFQPYIKTGRFDNNTSPAFRHQPPPTRYSAADPYGLVGGSGVRAAGSYLGQTSYAAAFDYGAAPLSYL